MLPNKFADLYLQYTFQPHEVSTKNRLTDYEILLNNYVVTKCGLEWGNCRGITSEGAANMKGRNIWVVERIKEAAGRRWHAKEYLPILTKYWKKFSFLISCTLTREWNTHTYCSIQRCAVSPKAEFLIEFMNWERNPCFPPQEEVPLCWFVNWWFAPHMVVFGRYIFIS